MLSEGYILGIYEYEGPDYEYEFDNGWPLRSLEKRRHSLQSSPHHVRPQMMP
jgi:hypothetical protein